MDFATVGGGAASNWTFPTFPPSAAPATGFGWDTSSTLPAYVVPNLVVSYAGTADIGLSVTTYVVASTVAPNGVLGAAYSTPAALAAAAVRSCAAVGATSPALSPSSRSFDMSGCNTLVNPAGSFATGLLPGSYYIVAMVSDGCNRGVMKTIVSNMFTIACSNGVNVIGSTQDATSSGTNGQITRTLVMDATHKFPDFVFNVTTLTTSTAFSLTYQVYWRPSTSTGGSGLASAAQTAFFGGSLGTNSVVPAVLPAGTFPVWTGGSGPLTSFGNVDMGVTKVPGGTRVLQFPASNAVSLTARTNTDPITGLIYNTVTNFGQSLFFDAVVGNPGRKAIYWSGDYYVRVSSTSTCATGTNNGDQLFTVQCPAVIDPANPVYGLFSATNNWGAVILNFGQNPAYFGSLPFESGTNYAADAYGGSTNGGFRVLTLTVNATAVGLTTAPSAGNPGIIPSYAPAGSASAISYKLSYKNPLSMAPNATLDSAAASAVTFGVYFQNPLLLSPFSYLNVPATQVNRSWVGNASPQNVALNMPGTWTINTYNTNGCANITGGSFDVSAYCYDNQLPEAALVIQVLSRPFSGSCAVDIGKDSFAGTTAVVVCDTTAQQFAKCTTTTAVRGPLGRPGGTGGGYARRRLVPEEESVIAAAAAGRKLLQTTPPTGLCTVSGLAAGSITAAFTAPVGPAVPAASYNLPNGVSVNPTTAMLTPNFAGAATVYFNSFDINPQYTPAGATDVRNFYGMGDLFGTAQAPDGKIAFGKGANNVERDFQGSFDNLNIIVDPGFAGASLRPVATPIANNKVITWLRINNWSTATFAGITNCAWTPAPLGTVQGAGAYVNVDTQMTLTGCNPIGTGAQAIDSTASLGVGSTSAAGVSTYASVVLTAPTNPPVPATVFPNSVAPMLTVSRRGSSTTNLFTWNAGVLGRTNTQAGTYDFQVIAWNGDAYKSCYDYRAVRVIAVCNKLYPYNPFTPAVAVTRSTTATEGPTLLASTMSAPAPVAVAAAVTSNWMTGSFDHVNLTAGFKYFQCGSQALPGGVVDGCGMQPGSQDGEGNYYSLQYSWNVMSAPATSIFTPANVTGPLLIPNPVVPDVNSAGMNLPPTTVAGQPNVQNMTTIYTSVKTFTQTNVQKWVKLINHGYKYPMTTLRPDVAGTYSVQLVINDGCSTWNSATVTITATCPALTLAFSTAVAVKLATSATNAASTTNAAVNPIIPIGATVYAVDVNGWDYNRISMSINNAAAPNIVAPANSYYTYQWTINFVSNVTTGQTVAPMNFQGEIASFVPTDLATPVDATLNPLTFWVSLTVKTNCLMDASTPQTTTISAYIVVNCNLAIDPTTAFIFYTPYVNTYNAAPQGYFGLSGVATNNNFVNNAGQYTTITQNLFGNTASVTANLNVPYYRMNNLLMTATPSNVGTPLTCTTNGPYCGPSGAMTGVPTILFGGSVPGTSAGYAVQNGVTGAAWQGLYVSVPVTLAPNLCKIKRTYWVLTSYQNAMPFVPSFVPSQVAPVQTCTTKSEWSWTVISTPCTPCTCATATSTTCAQYGQDVCDFDKLDQYKMTTVTVNTYAPGTTAPMSPNPATQDRINTGYVAPTFNYINNVNGAQPANAPAQGTNLNAYCVYDQGNRLDAVPNVYNMRGNCRLSGRGLAVDINQNGATAGTCTNGKAGAATTGAWNVGVTSMVCPMSNIAFVPGFPGTYQLQLAVYDYCGAPQTQTVTVTAMCRTTPAITVTTATISSFYDCKDPVAPWGNANQAGAGVPAVGAFGQVTLSNFVSSNGINATTVANNLGPAAKPATCAVVSSTTMNCTDVMNYVNNQNVMIDASIASGGNKFKACCTCLYGTQTINVFGGSTTGATPTPAPPVTPGTTGTGTGTPIGPTTQGNNLALDDAEYNRNNIILIALVTPIAVLLVGSLAGNVLMVLKMRQGASAGGGFNVRAGDVELSTSPRARVDV